jgi:hypothetical protein
LSTNNLGVPRGVGPASLGLNEYTPLFARNGFSLQLNGLAGTRDSCANDVVLGYVHDNVSFSLGQFHYQTDGYRENNQDRQDILTALVQMDVTPELSLQLEGRHRQRSFGDLEQTYDGGFDPTRRTTWTRDSIRGGLRWSPSPDSDLVLSVQRERFTEENTRADLLTERLVRSDTASDVSAATALSETMVLPGVTLRRTAETIVIAPGGEDRIAAVG